MPVRVTLPPSLKGALTDRPAVGCWLASASPVAAEIVAASGFDFIIIDAEHSPNELATTLSLLQVTAAYPGVTAVRLPVNDEVVIKQFLDLGAQTIIVPMVNSVEDAERAVRAARYPDGGVRGIGAALARSARWGLVPDYLHTATDHITVLCQIESAEAVSKAADIAAVDGVDGVFIGPADLAGTMGLLGKTGDQAVVDAVESVIADVLAAGKIVGVNAFDKTFADRYVAAGAQFVAVTADVTLLVAGARSTLSAWSTDN